MLALQLTRQNTATPKNIRFSSNTYGIGREPYPNECDMVYTILSLTRPVAILLHSFTLPQLKLNHRTSKYLPVSCLPGIGNKFSAF